MELHNTSNTSNTYTITPHNTSHKYTGTTLKGE